MSRSFGNISSVVVLRDRPLNCFLPIWLLSQILNSILGDKWTKNISCCCRANSIESAESDHTGCPAFDAMNQRIGIAMPTPCYFWPCHYLPLQRNVQKVHKPPGQLFKLQILIKKVMYEEAEVRETDDLFLVECLVRHLVFNRTRRSTLLFLSFF